MSLSDLQTKYEDFYVPRFEVRLGDVRFQESDGVISGLSVSTAIDRANHFSFTLNNLFDLERGEFGDLDWERLAEGPTVEISMGYGSTLEPMLLGNVDSAEPDFPSDGGPTVNVSGFGRLHELMEGTNSFTWKGSSDSERVKDSAVVSDVLSEGGYGFTETVIDEPGLEFRRIIQDKQSDYAFLKDRAWRYNFELFTRGDSFYFRKPRDDLKPDVTLGYGDSLSSLSLELNESSKVTKVEVRSIKPTGGKKEIVGSATGGDPGGETKTLRKPVESVQEAERIAEAEVSRIRQNRIRGRAEVLGLPEVTAGHTIRFEGLAGRFTGTYYIERADHRIGSGEYTTSFEVRRSQEGGS